MTIQLIRFLTPVFSQLSMLENIPEGNCQSSREWLTYFGSHLFLAAKPCKNGNMLCQATLMLAEHPGFGLLLLRNQPSLFSSKKFHALRLADTTLLELAPDDLEKCLDCHLLFEKFIWTREWSSAEVRDYLSKPCTILARQALVASVAANSIQSLLFITTFYVLSTVIPQHSLHSYAALSVLVLILLFYLSVFEVFSQRLNQWVHSYYLERRGLIQHGLLWSLSPTAFIELGENKVNQLVQLVGEIGQMEIEIVSRLATSVALVPIMVIMFFRLPLSLFIAIIAISVLGSSAKMTLRRKDEKKHEVTAKNEEQILSEIVTNIKTLNYYNQTAKALSLWHSTLSKKASDACKVLTREAFHDALDHFGKDTVYTVTLLLLAFMISPSRTQMPLTVTTVYLILFFASNLHSTIPQFYDLVVLRKNLHQAMKEATPLFADQAFDKGREHTILNHLAPKVVLDKISLPYGCRLTETDPAEPSFLCLNRGIVQIRGESGSGKSMLVRCMLGLEKLESGKIMIMGRNTAQLYPGERARLFSYIGQEASLVPGTLKDNLMLLCPAQDQLRELRNILSLVRLTDFVDRLPLGLDTPVANIRETFSTGELQRILLAQVLMKPCEILILDEAMSGVQEQLEITILTALREFPPLIFVVSHRNSLEALADHTITLAAREDSYD